MKKSDCSNIYNPISNISGSFLIWSMVVSQNGQIIACLMDSPYGGLNYLYAIPTVWDRKENTKITTCEMEAFESEDVFSEFPSLEFWPDQNHLLVIGRDRQPKNIVYENEKALRNWEIGSDFYSFPFVDILASMKINIECFVINESKNFIAIQSDKGIFYINLLTHELKKVTGNHISGSWLSFKPTMLFSPNNKFFAYSDGHMVIVDLEDNETVDTFVGAQNIVFPNTSMEQYIPGIYNEQWPLAFSPDGLHLVTRDNSGRLFIWNAAPFDIHKNINAPSGTQIFTSAQYSPDGKVLAIGTNDGSITFWDTISYSFIGQENNIHDGAVHTIKFSNDCNEMFTAGGTKIIIWKKFFILGDHNIYSG